MGGKVSWTGSQRGAGTSSDATTVLAPVPRVRPPHPRLVAAAPGKYEEGDLVVDRVSATYAEAALDDSALTATQELLYLVEGESYRLAQLHEEFLGWRLLLRRMRGR